MEIIRIREKSPTTAATDRRAVVKHKKIISGRTKNAILRGISYGAMVCTMFAILCGEAYPWLMYILAAISFGWLGLFIGVNGNREDLFYGKH